MGAFMAKTSILKTTKLTDYAWLNLYQTQYRRSGREGSWIFCSRRRPGKGPMSRRRPDAVVIVPTLVTKEARQLVLVKEYRVPLRTHEYHFPAGLVEEDVLAAASRELKEETGFRLTKVTHVSPRLFSSSGLSDESIVMVFADCVPDDGRQALDASEEIEVLLLDIDGVGKLLRKEVAIDAKSWPILVMIQNQGHI
jgi:ADP-ribose pyrophosphatase